MNTAQNLLAMAKSCGYTLTMNGDKLKVKPVPPTGLLEELRAHKAELLALLSSTPANDTDHTVTDRQRTFLKRDPLVTEADLNKMQRQLLGHLLTCRDCVVDDHLYCQQGGRDGSGYQGFLCEFPDAEQRHADFVSVVIQARIRGLQAGFTALDTLTRQDRDTGRETPCRPVYGIDKRPAELAFVNHFTACAFCFPRSGKYCGEGRELHDLARLEALQ